MAKIVRLKDTRRRKDRERRERKAEANRAWHGLTSSERESLLKEREERRRRHEGHRLRDPEDESGDSQESEDS